MGNSSMLSFHDSGFLNCNKEQSVKRKVIFFLIVHFPEPRGHHGVMTVANTFDISTSVIKVCKGWRGLLTFMVIKRVVGSALYVFDLISGRELTMHCFLKWPGKWKATGKTIRQKGAMRLGRAVFEVEGREQKNDILLVANTHKKKTFVIPAITNRMKKYIREHAWPASQGRGLSACPSRLQGTTQQRAHVRSTLTQKKLCILT